MLGFRGGSDGKESACSAEHPGSIPGSGRSPGEGNGNLLQYSCLENPMDRGAWWATVRVVTKELNTTERLSTEQKLFSETYLIVMNWQSTDHTRTRGCTVAPHAGSPVSYKEHPLISIVPNMGWSHAFRARRAVLEL